MSRPRVISLGVLVFWQLALTVCIGAEAGAFPEPTTDGVRFFERKIRPLLADKCYSCHSQASAKADGGLRLDSRDSLRHGGQHGVVIVPGNVAESSLIQKIRRPHPEGEEGPRLTLVRPSMLDLEAWVRMGAPDPRAEKPAASQASLTTALWAFQPFHEPPVPRPANLSPSADAIDCFVAEALQQRGIPRPPPADREILIRRVTYDLTGLPPSRAEVESFLNDKADGAFARAVDRLLSSPRFGEHWAGSWLQTIGYADISGTDYSGVQENAWRYRDYVINALNSDRPYDQFIREQLAGDLLADKNEAITHERMSATGFLLAGVRLPPELNRNRLALEVADQQLDLVGRAFLGLTVACARCHDHKTEPITMRDYYALAGIFTSTASLKEATAEGRRASARLLECSLATREELKALSQYESRFDELKSQLREAREQQAVFPGDIDSSRLTGVVVDNLEAEIHGAWKESNYSTNFVDRNYLHDGNADKGRKSARFVPELPKEGLYEVMVSYTPRPNRATNVPVTITCAAGSKTVYVDQTKNPTIDRVFTSVGQFNFDAGKSGAVQISNEATKGFVVVDAVRFVPVDKGAAPVRSEATQDTALLNYHQLEREVLDFRSKRPVIPQTLAVQEGKIRDCKLRLGGNPDKAGDDIPRGFIKALGTPDSTLFAITDEGSGRLELAEWLVQSQNPLTTRVAVNRIWAQLFGTGLVETVDDFGRAGAAPGSLPLLDHLACRFVELGWSQKKLIRAIVLSEAYQAGTRIPREGAAPSLPSWCMHTCQLPARVQRDATLALCGDLDLTAGGSWMSTNSAAGGPLQWARRVQIMSDRRSIYLPLIRDFVPETLRVFMTEPSINPNGRRPSPALTASAVDRSLGRWARSWASRLQHASPPDTTGRMTLAFRQAFGRAPTPEELAQAQTAFDKIKGKDPAPEELVWSAWENFCLGLLHAPEFGQIN